MSVLSSQPQPERTKSWVPWAVGVVILLFCGGFFSLAYIGFKFADDAQREERENNPTRSNARLLQELDGKWTRQGFSEFGISIESPAVLRLQDANSEPGWSTYTGAYPWGCVDIYFMGISEEDDLSPASDQSGIEAWIADFDGASDIKVGKSALDGIAADRRVFDARYQQDSYALVHFVEVREVGKSWLWITLHAYVEHQEVAKRDFQRMLKSLKVP